MSEVRDFDAEFKLGEREPFVFRLAGQEFKTKGWMPPHAFLARKDGTEGIVEFFQRVLVSEDAERFMALVEDPDVMIDVSQLDYIGGQIIQEVSARPTVSPA